MVTKRPAMTYEERQRFNGKLIVLPLVGLIGLAIYALVRGPQRLLLPQALIDRLYPYALLPWERSFAEGLSLFQQQFVVLALIGAITQAVIGLRAILPYMPEMKAISNVPRYLTGGIMLAMVSVADRTLFINAMLGDDPSSLPYIDTNKLLIKLMSPLVFCCTTFVAVMTFLILTIYMKSYSYQRDRLAE